MSVTFTGLASGIDSAALIDQLVAAEKRPAELPGQKVSASIATAASSTIWSVNSAPSVTVLAVSTWLQRIGQ
jgi:hypothetical protein